VIKDYGEGCINLLATRGKSRTIVNCHLDTVPADPTWILDPFSLVVQDDRAIGLGACDIKGAAASILTAAQETQGPLAILLTTDEEAGRSRCVRTFLSASIPYDHAVVAEPTSVCAVTEHRGLATFKLVFHGTPAHSSIANSKGQSAVHIATDWCAQALALTRSSPFDDICFNIGMVNGGTKPNVIASSATVVFGMRPPPGMDFDQPIRALKSLINESIDYTWTPRFSAPSLESAAGVENLITQYGLASGGAVDFWTEASLFNEAGIATIVLGPGSIDQAHTADEFVPLADLEKSCSVYSRIFSETSSSMYSNHSPAMTKGIHLQ